MVHMPISSKNLRVLPLFGALAGLISITAHAASLQIIYESQVEVQPEKSVLSGFFKKESTEIPLQLDQKVLATYLLEDLAKRKQASLTEIDPESKKSSLFKGVSLSQLVDEATKPLTAADRSHIDLVILKGKTQTALMPRAFLVKYSAIQLALTQDGKNIATIGPRVVLPATSNAKIQKESILLDPLFVSDLESVILTSYQFHYANLFLKKRSDPAAMRGEKLFVQNCVTCHQQGVNKSFEGVEKHREVSGASGLSNILEPKQLRSLTSYIEAYRGQEPAQAKK